MLWRACHHPHPESDDEAHATGSMISVPLAARTLAPIMARSLFRSYIPPPRRGPPPPDPPEAVALVRALIDEYPTLFHDMREEEGHTALALQGKVQRLAEVVEATRLPAAIDDPECLHLFRRLFAFLARVERRIHRASHVTASPTANDDLGGLSPPRRTRSGARPRRRGGERPTRANSASPRLRSPSVAALEMAAQGHEHHHHKHRGAMSEAGSPQRGHHSEHERDEDDEEEEGDEAGGEPFSFVSPRWEVRNRTEMDG
jgi:hypothetical protein